MPDYDTTSLANGVAQGVEDFERTYANGKIADQIVKVNPEVLQTLGMSPEQFGSMSAKDKTATVTGVITGMGIKAQQQQAAMQRAELSAKLQDFAAQADERKSVAESRAAMTGFAQDYATGNTAPLAGMAYPQTFNGGPTEQQLQALASSQAPQERMNYALQRNPGAFASREFWRNATALQNLAGNTGNGTLNFQEDPETGYRFGVMGKQVLPSGVNPGKLNSPMVSEQVPDANGTMHTILRDPKTGKATLVPNANAAQAQKLSLDSLVEAEKATRAIDDDIGAWRSQFNRSQKDKSVKAPDPAVLKDLQQRRTRIQNALSGATSPTTATPTGTGKNAPPDVQALIDQARKAIAAGKDPNAVQTRLGQLLKEKGYSLQSQ